MAHDGVTLNCTPTSVSPFKDVSQLFNPPMWILYWKKFMTSRKKTGNYGERAVAFCLAKRGFRILGMNVHTRWGEVDIIAERQGVIHAIEVKTRRSNLYGTAAEGLTKKQFTRIKKTITTIRQEEIPFIKGKTQIDFAAVELRAHQPPMIQIFWNISEQDF